MKASDVEIKLQELQSYTKHSLVTIAQFRMLFPAQQENALKVRLHHLVKRGNLEKVCRGVWSYPKSKYYPTTDLRYLPHLLRHTDINYISLESVLSKHSIISQQMFNFLTVMTTGRCGKFDTSLGTLELIHTKRDPLTLVTETFPVQGLPIREATIERAWQDLKNVGRNIQMVDLDELETSIAEQNSQVTETI
jgi:predicted transcriptional regulator of viral defense system